MVSSIKRSGFKNRGKPLARNSTLTPKRGDFSAYKPMPRVSAKKKAYRRSKAAQDNFEYMGAVKQCPCCACGKAGPSYAHHCTGDGMARNDLHTIPLCYECHQGDRGYHARKATWERNHGKDHSHIPATQKLVEELSGIVVAYKDHRPYVVCTGQ